MTALRTKDCQAGTKQKIRVVSSDRSKAKANSTPLKKTTESSAIKLKTTPRPSRTKEMANVSKSKSSNVKTTSGKPSSSSKRTMPRSSNSKNESKSSTSKAVSNQITKSKSATSSSRTKPSSLTSKTELKTHSRSSFNTTKKIPKSKKSTVIKKPKLNKAIKLVSMGLGSSSEVDMSGPAAQFVKELINSDSIVIFSKSYCPYCKMAKEVFDNLKQKYTTIELDNRDDADAIQSVLGEMTGARTVPRVFVKGECLGGGSDVKQLYDSGKLMAKLK
ncbi:hypothetical protein C0J52_01004 [Blattella germanica]|nr:hypothetical protein C0J52_01004 [Blattella germanica]